LDINLHEHLTILLLKSKKEMGIFFSIKCLTNDIGNRALFFRIVVLHSKGHLTSHTLLLYISVECIHVIVMKHSHHF